jgi:hypothetical protein
MRLSLPKLLDAQLVSVGLTGLGWEPPGSASVLCSAKQPPQHVEPIALVALAAWASAARARGVRVIVDDSLKSPYLARTGLLRALATDVPGVQDIDGDERFLSLCRFRSSAQGERLVELLTPTLHLDRPELKQAVCSVMRELCVNAAEHGVSEQGAWVAAGWFPKQRRITMAIADLGVGIMGTTRRKGLLTPEDDERDAIEKALEYRITGAGEPGEPEAPNNGGLGLYWARCYTQGCRGEMVIHTHQGRFAEGVSGQPEQLELVEARWPGTLVSVTIRPDELSKHRGLTFPTALSSPLYAPRLGPGPADALVLCPPVDSAGFAGTKEWYIHHQSALRQALAEGRHVRLDFGGALYVVHSAANALLGEPLRVGGPDWVRRIWVHNTRGPIDSILRVVIADALGDHARRVQLGP